MDATNVRLGPFSLGVLLLGSLVVGDSAWVQSEVLFIRQDFGVGVGAISVTVGDFNGDGHQDLATANRDANSVSILLGQGDGTFQAAPDVGVGRPHFGVTVGDFNGDGHQDLATTNIGPNLPNSVSILLGQGDGTFQAAPDIEVGADPRSVIVGDFNGNGHEDLAVANLFSNSVSILLGQGDGTFQAASDLQVGELPATVTIGDFNGDGHQDLATANISDTVSILLGQGDGTFQVAPNFVVGDQPHSIAVGDFNGDGHQDLATPSLTASTVSIRLGQGDGTFQAAPDVGVGAGAISVTVGDFDGDGHQDIAAVNQNINTVSILLGQGDGTFAAAQDFEVGGTPASITVGDFNGDGRPDLATANVSGTVSILINNTPAAIVVTIDIKPGNFPNSINPTSKGVIPTAILTTDTFDATTVDPLSVRFGRSGARESHGRSHIEDADGDGDLDLVLHFRTQDTGIVCEDTSVFFTGETFGGQAIQGTDSIKTVGCR
jgi:FG-GAP-like repeat